MKITVEIDIPDEENCRMCDMTQSHQGRFAGQFYICPIFDDEILENEKIITPCAACLRARGKG